MTLPALKGQAPAPRSQRIGSGDIASILGLPDAFGSPYSVWLAKTTGQEPEPDERTLARWWWGEEMEPVILKRYGLLSPGHTPIDGGYQRHFVHLDYPFLTATTDGLFTDEHGVYIVEAKLSNFDLNDGIPHRVQAQAQWQMGISGIRRAVAAVLFISDISRDLQIWDLDFDEDVFGMIFERAMRFHFDHVVKGVPPQIDGLPDDVPHAFRDPHRAVRVRSRHTRIDGVGDLPVSWSDVAFVIAAFLVYHLFVKGALGRRW